MSRIVFALVAVGAVIIMVALGVAWTGKRSDQAAIDNAAKPAPPAPLLTPPSTPPPAAAKPPENKPVAAAPSPSAPMPPAAPSTIPAPAPSAAVMAPSFDVARVGTDGRAVIAGRAAPGAKIVLLDGGKEIARGVADDRGEWVLLAQDPPLAPGQHELRVVQHLEGRAPVTSEQVVVAVVPSAPAVPAAPTAGTAAPGTSASATPPAPEPAKEQTLVLISPPSGASTLVQSPSAAGAPKSGDMQLSTLDYDERGHVTVSGQATPGATVRAYIDDKMVGEGVAGADGRWRLAPQEPIGPGKHTLRLDRLAADGKPASRLQEMFERLVSAPVAGDNRRLTVVRGDNLWNIARAHYGEGFLYTVIFDANKTQIRDPNMIYPGQIFSLPKVN
ncbi:MAG: LysM peptidoglycan-binding domain-containing protein [Alphaproteobacteria bacterium]|nr:LysM peptidoglycan-binding domain-containing protein [Alphaproteobacteria bacterium]